MCQLFKMHKETRWANPPKNIFKLTDFFYVVKRDAQWSNQRVNTYHIILILGKNFLLIINITNPKNVWKLSTIWNIPGSADFLSPPIESPDKLVYPIRRKEPVQRMEKLETVYPQNNCLTASAPNSQERWSSRVGWKP